MRRGWFVKATSNKGPKTQRATCIKTQKAHHTRKHTRERRAHGRREARTYAHARMSYVPPQAQQGIIRNGQRRKGHKRTTKPTCPPTTAARIKPPPYIQRTLSRLSTRKEIWYEGHTHASERRGPRATGEHTTATKHAYNKPVGTRRASGMPKRALAQATQGMAMALLQEQG